MAGTHTRAAAAGGGRRAGVFERVASAVGAFSGSTGALVAAVALVAAWAATGPVFGYSRRFFSAHGPHPMRSARLAALARRAAGATLAAG